KAWRTPLAKKLRIAQIKTCPPHAISKMEDWSRKFNELGFTVLSDHSTDWKLGSRERKTYLRFLKHQTEPFWVEIYALQNPKIIARQVITMKGTDRTIVTCDRTSDAGLFDGTEIQQLSESVSCEEMIERHRRFSMTGDGPNVFVLDPASAHERL